MGTEDIGRVLHTLQRFGAQIRRTRGIKGKGTDQESGSSVPILLKIKNNIKLELTVRPICRPVDDVIRFYNISSYFTRRGGTYHRIIHEEEYVTFEESLTSW